MCFCRGTVWRCPCGFLRRCSFWAGLNLWRGAALNFLQTLTSGWRSSGANGINSRLVSLCSVYYMNMFFQTLRNVRVLFGKSLLKAQSITSVRGPFVERKGFLNSRLSKSALLWHRWVSHLETDLCWSTAPCRDERKRAVGKICLECKKKLWRHCQYKNAM